MFSEEVNNNKGMSVKELKDILDNCKQDAEVYIMCSIGPGLPVKFKPFDIYECKADGSIRFDFIDYIYENELEEKLYSYNGGTSELYSYNGGTSELYCTI